MTEHAEIQRIVTQLTEAQARFRETVRQHVRQAGGADGEPAAAGLLQSLRLPALTVPEAQARDQIQADHGWNENTADYTEAGMTRQVQRVSERAADWYGKLRVALSDLARNRTITQAQADEVIRTIVPADALPQERRITVTYTVTGSASARAADVPPGTPDVVIQAEAERALQAAITGIREQNGFRMENDTVVTQITITRS